MKELFNLDMQDYNPNGKIYSRPSVRAIIHQDGKVLLVYSKRYNYYKFPGGGIEKNETKENALIREVMEETGYQIVSETIAEYGKVLRRQKDSYDENTIFQQENYYYFAAVTGMKEQQKLDAYEAEEGFTPMWVDPAAASHHNKYAHHADGADLIMITRDARVLDMVDLEIGGREKK